MTPIEFAMLFAAIGVILLVADLFVPSHGLLTVAGVVAFVVAVVCCFVVSARLGAYVGAALIIVSPFATMLMLRLWPHTVVGRRMTLAGVETHATSPAAVTTDQITPGERGTALTELRPVGMCDFAGQRVEAVSDRGIVAHGTAVFVVAVQNRRPIVRPLEDQIS